MVNPLNLSLANFKVNKRLTVAANSEGSVSISVPGDAYSFVSEIGYTKKLDSEYKLSTGKDFFNWGKNQVGSQTVPYLFNPPRQIRGEVTMVIKNNSSASKEYGITFGIASTGTITADSDEGSVLPDISRFDERIKVVYKYGGATIDSGVSPSGSTGVICAAGGANVGSGYTLTSGDAAALNSLLSGSFPVGAFVVMRVKSSSASSQAQGRIRLYDTDGTTLLADSNAIATTSTSYVTGNVALEYSGPYEAGMVLKAHACAGVTSYTADVALLDSMKLGIVFPDTSYSDLSGYYVDEIYVAANTTVTLNTSSTYTETSNTTYKFTEPIILRSFSFESGDIIYMFKEA